MRSRSLRRLGRFPVEADAERVRTLITTPVGARAHNSAALTIGTGSLTALTFDSERWDHGGVHSTASNTGRLTCTRPGVYFIVGHVRWEANATGVRKLAVRFHDSSVPSDTYICAELDADAGADDEVGQSVATTWALEIDDYVELFVYQDSGGDLDIQVGNTEWPGQHEFDEWTAGELPPGLWGSLWSGTFEHWTAGTQPPVLTTGLLFADSPEFAMVLLRSAV